MSRPLYWSPDGQSAIVVAEEYKRLDFRDPHSMKLLYSIATTQCGTLRLSPYFNRPEVLAIIDKHGKKPRKIPDPSELGAQICTTKGMPQDVRASPDGRVFFVADMMADGVHVVDVESCKQIGFIPTGVGAHGLLTEPRR